MELKDSTVFIGIVITSCMVLLLLCAGVSAANRSHTCRSNDSYVKCGPVVYGINSIETVEEKQANVETPKPVEKHSAVNKTDDVKSLEKPRSGSVVLDIVVLMTLLLIGMLPIIAVWVECREHKSKKMTLEEVIEKNEQRDKRCQRDPLEEAKKKVLESL